MKTKLWRAPQDAWRCGISIAFAWHELKYPDNHADVKMHMFVQAGAKPVYESDCANVQGGLVRLGCARAVGLQALRDDPPEDA